MRRTAAARTGPWKGYGDRFADRLAFRRQSNLSSVIGSERTRLPVA